MTLQLASTMPTTTDSPNGAIQRTAKPTLIEPVRVELPAQQKRVTPPSTPPSLPSPSPASAPETPTLGTAFQNRSNNVAVMRLALALTVVFSHCYPLTLGAGNGDLLYRTTSTWWHGTIAPITVNSNGAVSLVGGSVGSGITTGFIAVCAFFVLSGFVISHSFNRAKNKLDFFYKRAKRLYPAYLLSALVCFLVIAPLALAALPATLVPQLPTFTLDALLLRQYQLNGLFTENPFPNALNGSLWSIKYEVICYALVATIGTLGLMKRPKLVVALLAAVASIYAAQTSGLFASMNFELWWPRKVAWLAGEISHWPRVLTYHLSGMTLYLYRNRLPYSGKLALGALAATIALGLIGPTFVMIGMPLLIGYVALYVAFSTRGRHFTAKLDRLDLSYGVYLYAFPIQQLLVHWISPTRGNPLLLFVLAAPIVVGLAIVSRRVIELLTKRPAATA